MNCKYDERLKQMLKDAQWRKAAKLLDENLKKDRAEQEKLNNWRFPKWLW